jgi:hypothetical protein
MTKAIYHFCYNIPAMGMNLSLQTDKEPFQSVIAKSSPSANADRFETIHDLSVKFLSSARPALTIRTFLLMMTDNTG